MATQINNVVTPAQAALNSKLYGSNAFGQAAPTQQSSFDTGASSLIGGIGNAINKGISAIGGVKFGQQPASGSFPVSPSLQASANTAQNAPASGVIASPSTTSGGIQTPPVGQTTVSTGQNANPGYVPGSIGPGNTPFLPAGTTASGGTGGAAGSVVSPNITASATTPQPVPTTFPGLVGATATAGQNAVNTGSSQEQEAFQKAQALQSQLAGSQENEANTLANMQGNPIPIEFQQGRGNIVQNLYQQQQNALASELQGQSNLAGQGTAVQGQGIGALGTATGAAQPQLAGIGSQQYYNPLDTSSAGASNQYGTGPAAAANVASIQQHTSNINDWSAARQSAANIGSQLTGFLQQNQINPSDFNGVNKFLQAIGAQTSSPQYKQFYNLVTDLANTYAPVLGQGDASNYKVQLAQSLLDGTANGQSIPQILQGLDQQAQAKIQGEQQTVDRLQNGENPNPTSTNTGSNSSVSGFAWSGN